MTADLSSIDPTLRKRFGVPDWFAEHCEKLKRGELKNASRLDVPFGEAGPGDLAQWPAEGSAQARELTALGEAALREGKVAVLVVAGGMATRFGGGVKGVVPVVGGMSFLELKIADARRAGKKYGKRLPFLVMTSFATQELTERHLAERVEPGTDIILLPQHVAVRLTRDGSFFKDAQGQLSYHGPGHGDFYSVIRPWIPKLRSQGVEVLLFSNVDNLGATVEPKVVGLLLKSGKDMAVEVTERWAGESGAAPVRIGNHFELVEGFRLPADLDPNKHTISTNSIAYRLSALDQDILPPVRVVEKEVDGQKVIQLETITCEATGLKRPSGEPLLSWMAIEVPRQGPEGRFYPVKKPADLDAVRPELEKRLGALF